MHRRLRTSLIIAAATVAAMAAAPVAGAASLSASLGSATHFPDRTLVVSAPGNHSVSARSVHVEENGAGVRDVSVTPISTASQGSFGVMLVIDASQSMRGEPLRQAMLAARTLAGQRAGNQELGVIEFNRATSIVLPLTSDGAKIDAALAQTVKLASGTHIYDATLQAIGELRSRGVAAGTVIVLSDGADVGSRVSPQVVAAAAGADHVRVYTVGVRDRTFSPHTLNALARDTNGSYTASDAAGLRGVFSRIESQLTQRYIVRYRSAQRLGAHVQVNLWADGLPGVWVGRYAAPPPPPRPAPRPAPAPTPGHAGASFWTTSTALVLVVLVCSVVLVGGLLAHFVPRTRRDALRRRIAEFTDSEPEGDAQSDRGPALSDRAENWLVKFRWWAAFKEEVDIAGITRSPAEVLILTETATLAAAALLSLIVGSPLVTLPVLVIGPVVMVATVRQRAARQRRLFAEQLPGHLEEIGSAMRAGHSVFGSIASMADEAADPSGREFKRAVADERLGVPVDAALRPIARRMRSSDIQQLSLVATLNQRTGGNMAEVLDVIAAGARERNDLRRELRSLTAQARLSKAIVTALPVGLLALLTTVNLSYVRPLFTTTGGIVVLCVATGLVLTGWVVMGVLVPAEE